MSKKFAKYYWHEIDIISENIYLDEINKDTFDLQSLNKEAINKKANLAARQLVSPWTYHDVLLVSDSTAAGNIDLNAIQNTGYEAVCIQWATAACMNDLHNKIYRRFKMEAYKNFE